MADTAYQSNHNGPTAIVQNTGAMRNVIAASWRRCERHQVDRHRPVLSPTRFSPGNHSLQPYEWINGETMHHSFQKIFDLFLQEYNAVFFVLDLKLNIIYQNGDQRLLERLNAINLGLGANLNEKEAGTNAAALALFNQERGTVAGAEHYLEILQDLACIAAPVFLSSNIPIGYVMYVVDAADFTSSFQEQLHQYLDVQDYLLGLEFENLKLCLHNEAVNGGIDLKECGCLFIDNNGLIIYANEWIGDYFGLEAESVMGKHLDQVFPELTNTLERFQSGKTIRNKTIDFHHSQSAGKLTISSILPDLQGLKNGMVIILSEDKPLKKPKKAGQGAHFTFDDLIGTSPSFSELKKIADVASASSCNVMIIGESGTGKELFAQAIHNNSQRRNGPFISINCAAIPKELIYSELFGYIEGAFTGAKRGGAPGKFELANKGTLFLDEIGEISNEMQAVLLRVLEEDSITRLGSSTSTPIDVRIIAATNRDICSSVAATEFRLDLYHRLCTVRIDIDPLRRRKEDIPVLADYFLKVFTAKHQKNIQRITPEAFEYMQHCAWLGNVRELRNVIERGVIFCSTDELSISDLPKELEKHYRAPDRSASVNLRRDTGLAQQFQEKLDEKRHIELLLKKRSNNKTLVAQDLGITRATLYRKMKFFGIQ
jgi:transcriptional regulator with PAS, ATPase and Fis domain